MACAAETEPRGTNAPAAVATRVKHQQRAHDAHALRRFARDLRDDGCARELAAQEQAGRVVQTKDALHERRPEP